MSLDEKYTFAHTTKDDKDAILHLIENDLSDKEREFLQWNVLKSVIVQDIENENECYVVKTKEKNTSNIISFVRTSAHGKFLEDLVVSNKHRHEGVASFALNSLPHLPLYATTDFSNFPIYQLLTKFGFHIISLNKRPSDGATYLWRRSVKGINPQPFTQTFHPENIFGQDYKTLHHSP